MEQTIETARHYMNQIKPPPRFETQRVYAVRISTNNDGEAYLEFGFRPFATDVIQALEETAEGQKIGPLLRKHAIEIVSRFGLPDLNEEQRDNFESKYLCFAGVKVGRIVFSWRDVLRKRLCHQGDLDIGNAFAIR